jgi:hypothetical protein
MIALASCGGPAPPSSSRPVAIAPLDAGPSVRLEAPARGEVGVSLFGENGAYWPGVTMPDPPGEIVKPCIEGPDAVRPLVSGWIVFTLGVPPRGPARVKLLESSRLPDGLLACMERALEGLRVAAPDLSLPPLLAYVSIR